MTYYLYMFEKNKSNVDGMRDVAFQAEDDEEAIKIARGHVKVYEVHLPMVNRPVRTLLVDENNEAIRL